jgi:hypothetical protein
LKAPKMPNIECDEVNCSDLTSSSLTGRAIYRVW